jgi:ATP-dependent Clp protease adapter protein ClpS
MATAPVLEPEVGGPQTGGQGRWMTVIFNDDETEMGDVVAILMTATGCDEEEAYIEMWEAHTFGKAPCHFGTQEECEEVARIIAVIGVETEVVPEWEDA